jgi:DNA ligase-associated metallophosphoesterase
VIAFEWQNEKWWLHPLRGMYREKNQTLILSDVHLGKTGHFRKEGIAVPQDVYREDLRRLFSLMDIFKPKEVIFTGDLFHSRFNLEWEWFAAHRKNCPDIQFHLVLGNHDKLSHALAAEMGLTINPQLDIDGITFLHNYNDKPEGNPYPVIYGHLHPSVKISLGVRQSARLPCFVFSPNACIMPAFSLFTGSMTIKPRRQNHVFVIAENKIIPL